VKESNPSKNIQYARRENITDWALEQFRSRYHDPSLTKWDIFHYIYAILHHAEYRQRYAAPGVPGKPAFGLLGWKFRRAPPHPLRQRPIPMSS